MATALGLLALLAFIACVIALAAGVTAAVVKLTPAKREREPEQPAS